jgi:hypothetical protein
MKKQEKFTVIRNKETGEYLVSYKSNEKAFAYSSTWTDDLQDAATGSLKAMEKQGDKMQKVAEAFGGEILVVEAEYTLKTLDGEEPKDLTKEIEEAKRKHFENFLRGLLSDNDEED